MDLSGELSAPTDKWHRRKTTIGKRLLAISVYLERFNTLTLCVDDFQSRMPIQGLDFGRLKCVFFISVPHGSVARMVFAFFLHVACHGKWAHVESEEKGWRIMANKTARKSLQVCKYIASIITI